MYVNIHVCMYAYVYVYVYMQACVYAYMYAYMHACRYACMYGDFFVFDEPFLVGSKNVNNHIFCLFLFPFQNFY